jgi:DNA-binding MarR family transcriptional regulator
MGEFKTLDEQLCYSIYSAGLAINRTYKPLLDELGITYPQYLVLNALWEQDDQPIGAIGERLALESSTLTPLLKRLEAAGLVTRRRGPDDERQVFIALTERGQTLRDRAQCLGQAFFVGSGMDMGRLGRLNEEIKQLRDAFTANLAKAG